jgi:UDP-N-acetylmuramoyl-tripeptide--D-alanyl-D-alanine ligase
MIRVHDVLAGTQGDLLGDLSSNALLNRVVHDSRSVAAGDLFVAIRGEHLDGHAYVADAVEQGARAALVSAAWQQSHSEPPIPLIVVPDTLQALQNLAAYWRGIFRLHVIGITGSIGKTSTKEVVAAVVSSKHVVQKSQGNFNNEIGLPLSVLDITPDSEVVVLEMGGAYAFGEIAQLAQIARPDIGIVTNVTHSHLSRMGSLEAIAQTKIELIESLPSHGVAILNIDDELVRAMGKRANCRVVYYGLDPSANLRAVDLESRGVDGTAFTLSRGGQENHIHIPLLGLHSVHAALAAFAVGFELGMQLPDMLRGLDTPEIQLRLLLTPGVNGSTILDDHYNSNPKSSFAALALLEDLTATRRIAVLGDMLELGDYEEEGHRLVGRRLIDVVDALYTLGPRARIISEEAKSLKPSLPTFHFEDKPALVEALTQGLQPGDLVLVKGSRGLAMETVVTDLRDESGQVRA